MTPALLELIRQYKIFCMNSPLYLVSDHDFGHFMSWLETQALLAPSKEPV